MNTLILLLLAQTASGTPVNVRQWKGYDGGTGWGVYVEGGTITTTGGAAWSPDGGAIGYMVMPDGGPLEVTVAGGAAAADTESAAGTVAMTLDGGQQWSSAWIDTLGYAHMDVSFSWAAGGNATSTLGVWWSPDAVSYAFLENITSDSGPAASGKYEIPTKQRYAQVYVTNNSGTWPLDLSVWTTLRVEPGMPGTTLSSQSVPVNISGTLVTRDVHADALAAGSDSSAPYETPCVDMGTATLAVLKMSQYPSTIYGYTDSSCTSTATPLEFTYAGMIAYQFLQQSKSQTALEFIVDLAGHRYFKATTSINFTYRVTAGTGVPSWSKNISYQKSQLTPSGGATGSLEGWAQVSQRAPNVGDLYTDSLWVRPVGRAAPEMHTSTTTCPPNDGGFAGNVAGLVVASPHYDRMGLCLYNAGTATIYLGDVYTLPSTGLPLPAGGYWCDENITQPLYCVADAEQPIRVLEH